jgi:hypothetical protein
MVTAYRYLRGTRNRPLLPHRHLAPMRELLLSSAEMARAYASTFDDERWRAAADALDDAAAKLRAVL